MTTRGWFVLLAACGSSSILREVKRTPVGMTTVELEKLMGTSVTNGGLVFDDPACTFPAGPVPPAKVSAFAKCVGALHLEASDREDDLGDVLVLRYAPGFEVEARIVEEPTGPHLTWIGYSARRAGDPDVPSITKEALEGLRLSGELHGGIEVPGLEAEEATWLKYCLDASGAVTKVEDFETTSLAAAKAFIALAQTWKFRPFVTRGKPMAVCAMVKLSQPLSTATEVLPLPPPPSRNNKTPVVVPTALLENNRITGSIAIPPDDLSKVKMAERHMSAVRGTFRVCLDETGTPESILPLRTTGLPEYDTKIQLQMHDWRFKPFKVDDQAVPVCMRVSFKYSQS